MSGVDQARPAAPALADNGRQAARRERTLTKDLRLRRDLLATMYPELDRFHRQRALVDPEGILRSDLGRRLSLCETAS
jgi:hypothetical protein